MSGREGRLLDLSEVVLGILVQGHFTDTTKRKVFVRKHFRQIERIERQLLHLFVRRDLNEERPTGKIFLFDGIVKISQSVIGLFTS